MKANIVSTCTIFEVRRDTPQKNVYIDINNIQTKSLKYNVLQKNIFDWEILHRKLSLF